jgi:hypothetical protein
LQGITPHRVGNDANAAIEFHRQALDIGTVWPYLT